MALSLYRIYWNWRRDVKARRGAPQRPRTMTSRSALAKLSL